MPDLEPVNNHVNVVLVVFCQRRNILAIHDLTIYAKAHIAQCLHLGQYIGEFAFLVTGDGSQQHHPCSIRQCQQGVRHLADRLRLQRQIVVGTVRRAGAGEQQAQVIVDFRHRAHGGARIVAGGFLFDADGGRETFDQIHIRFVHDLQELARVGGQAFHIAALAFCIQGVKCQAGFARAGKACDNYKLVAWNVQVDVLEVVRARATNADVGMGRRCNRLSGGFLHRSLSE